MNRPQKWIAATTLIIATLLLFARLGHYPLWDDESLTALEGQAVWKTGDTSVMLDHNVVAYRGTYLLSGQKERSTPPLPAYLVSPFVGLFGSAGMARLPFALLGLATVGIIFLWLRKLEINWLAWLLMAMGLIGNVSFWLYCKQCRYYSPAIFATAAVAFIYFNYSGKRWQLLLMAAAGLMLLGSNYVNYLVLHLCLLADYLVVGRKRYWMSVNEWLIALLPQVVIGGAIVLVWNSLGTQNGQHLFDKSFSQHIHLIWSNLRDMNYSEFYCPLTLIAASVLYFISKKAWLLRAVLLFLLYVLLMALLSPQPMWTQLDVADVRYVAPIIPLGIAISVMVLMEIGRFSKWPAIGLAMLIFGSNLLNGSPLWKEPLPPARSTIWAYANELCAPPADPYTPAIQWVRQNVSPGQSVWVMPDYMMYPLMYHAPQPVYAWQFAGELPAAMKDLPRIHVRGEVLPDYIVVFGPILQRLLGHLHLPPGKTYQIAAVIPVYWQDQYRPDLLVHRFYEQPMNQEAVNAGQGIYIFRLVNSATTQP